MIWFLLIDLYCARCVAQRPGILFCRSKPVLYVDAADWSVPGRTRGSASSGVERQYFNKGDEANTSIVLQINVLIILWFSWFLRLVELNRIVDVAQHSGHTILVLHVEPQKRHHAEVIDQLRNGPVQLLE